MNTDIKNLTGGSGKEKAGGVGRITRGRQGAKTGKQGVRVGVGVRVRVGVKVRRGLS
jgi:hypothetical protein